MKPKLAFYESKTGYHRWLSVSRHSRYRYLGRGVRCRIKGVGYFDISVGMGWGRLAAREDLTTHTAIDDGFAERPA